MSKLNLERNVKFNCVVRRSTPDNVQLGHITLSFWRGRQRNVPRIQVYCYSASCKLPTALNAVTGTSVTKFNEQCNSLHKGHNSWYISLPSFAKLKQRRDFTKVCVVWRKGATRNLLVPLLSRMAFSDWLHYSLSI